MNTPTPRLLKIRDGLGFICELSCLGRYWYRGLGNDLAGRVWNEATGAWETELMPAAAALVFLAAAPGYIVEMDQGILTIPALPYQRPADPSQLDLFGASTRRGFGALRYRCSRCGATTWQNDSTLYVAACKCGRLLNGEDLAS